MQEMTLEEQHKQRFDELKMALTALAPLMRSHQKTDEMKDFKKAYEEAKSFVDEVAVKPWTGTRKEYKSAILMSEENTLFMYKAKLRQKLNNLF